MVKAQLWQNYGKTDVQNEKGHSIISVTP